MVRYCRFFVISFFALAGFTVPVQAIVCSQSNAIYQNGDQSFFLEFQNGSAKSEIAGRSFLLKPTKNKLILDGIVFQTDEMDRSIGMAMNSCPEGDVTGKELADCIVWQGGIYTIDDSGQVGNLPLGNKKAANRVLLTDFGHALEASNLFETNEKNSVLQDVFKFKSCAKQPT